MPNMATSLGTHSYPYISILYLSSCVNRVGSEKNKGHGVTAALSKSIMGILWREGSLDIRIRKLRRNDLLLFLRHF